MIGTSVYTFQTSIGMIDIFNPQKPVLKSATFETRLERVSVETPLIAVDAEIVPFLIASTI